MRSLMLRKFLAVAFAIGIGVFSASMVDLTASAKTEGASLIDPNGSPVV